VQSLGIRIPVSEGVSPPLTPADSGGGAGSTPVSGFTLDAKRIGKRAAIFSQGENPAVYGGRESDTC